MSFEMAKLPESRELNDQIFYIKLYLVYLFNNILKKLFDPDFVPNWPSYILFLRIEGKNANLML